MAEVLSVIYMGNEELSPDMQLGTIVLFTEVEGTDYHIIYNVQSDDMSRPSIKPGDELILTGPSSLLPLCPYNSVDVDIFSGAYKGILTVEVPPSRGQSFCTIEKRLLSQDGTGELCVLFRLSYNARPAFLELNWFSHFSVEVCGVIVA